MKTIPKNLHKKILDIIYEFSKVVRYKISVQKLTIFLLTRNAQWVSNSFKIPLTIAQNVIFRYKSNTYLIYTVFVY